MFLAIKASTEAILLITTQSTRIAISTVHKLKINCLRFISSSSCPSQKLRGFEFPRRRKLKCFPLDSQIVFSWFNFMLLLGSKRYELTTFFFTLH
ncbi:hypothetical protein NC653_014866 [Populus alba x Populus x berolinensis]|uniref:Uncharacterized protein n=1 Tax=Populus alba x Populus x berolinensis TaxID=444605 RepID=A0AAD6QZ69_9ROSI|nr:hypothetical protein NC653_014866 [Populus alba x Populus x berolinensis]